MYVYDLLFNLGMLAVDGWLLRTVRRRALATGLGAALLQILIRAQVASFLMALALEGMFQASLFGVLRLVAYGLFLHGGIQLLGSALLLAGRSRNLSWACALGASTLALVATDAFLLEPRWLEVTHTRITSPKIREPLTVAVLADLQTDRIGAWERKIFKRALAEAPDLVLLPGDYLQAESHLRFTELARELRTLLQELGFSAALGVYAVAGNTDSPAWRSIFQNLPVTTFGGTGSEETSGLRVTGLSLRDSFDPRLEIAAAESFHIAFGHGPDFALGAVEADLLVAGHTHGGQVRLPGFGPILTFSRIPRAWATGVTELPALEPGGDPRFLAVSRGLGMERGRAPRLRFLCRPELMILHLDSGAPSSVLDR